MPFVTILVGVASGILLGAVSLGLLGGLIQSPALTRGAHVAARGAAAILVIGALLGWGSGLPTLESVTGMVDRRALEGPVLSLMLMAALAIPLRVDGPGKAPWSSSLLYVPAWLLSSTALFHVASPARAAAAADWVTPLRFSLAVCGGVGARAAGQSLQAIAAGNPGVEWPGRLAYGMLTLVWGVFGLVNLWQRGGLWVAADPVLRGGMTGAWLAWTADWVMPRRHWRIGAALTMLAALLLVLAAVRTV